MRTTILLIICFVVTGCASRRSPESGRHHPFRGFPSYPPIRDANPQVREKRTFQVPTRLIVVRSEDQISVSVDQQSLVEIELEVGYKMVAGFKSRLFVISQGERKHRSSGLGGSANIGTSFLHRSQGGIPQPGRKYVIEVEFVIFETDIPGQHLWSPKSGRYRELWSKTITSEEI